MSSYMANINGDISKTKLRPLVCPECPWRKKDKQNTYQPALPDKIFDMMDRFPMACHMSQHETQAFADNKVLRCRGVATFKANIGQDDECLPDTETVFASKEEALASWKPIKIDWELLRENYFREYPYGEWFDENGKQWVAGILLEGQ